MTRSALVAVLAATALLAPTGADAKRRCKPGKEAKGCKVADTQYIEQVADGSVVTTLRITKPASWIQVDAVKVKCAGGSSSAPPETEFPVFGSTDGLRLPAKLKVGKTYKRSEVMGTDPRSGMKTTSFTVKLDSAKRATLDLYLRYEETGGFGVCEGTTKRKLKRG